MTRSKNLRTRSNLLLSFALVILFAIVAKEIRHLAVKSAGAAKEIGGIIPNSIKITEHDPNLTEGTTATLDDMENQSDALQELLALFKKKGESSRKGLQSPPYSLELIAGAHIGTGKCFLP